jgi:hypothetical protein
MAERATPDHESLKVLLGTSAMMRMLTYGPAARRAWTPS